MDYQRLLAMVDAEWERSILPQLHDYIRIPCKSPAFDRQWAETGHLEKAVKLIETWCKAQPIEGLEVEIVRLPGRSPLLFMEIPATDGSTDETVMLYGHFDKQPEMTGWREDLGPWVPVREGDKLYGRGGADDGYAAFASLLAISALRKEGAKHKRCVVLIEGCEESGSFDLPFYLEHLSPRIGDVSLVVCLDSGCGNYEQLWVTTSLRGLVGGTLTVNVLEQGVHSGDASGVVPSSFRIARQLLSRLEDADTGRILPQAFHTAIPEDRAAQAKTSGRVLAESLFARFPYAGTTHAMSTDFTELVLNRTWRPFLSVTGAAGLPPIDNAGNVLRPSTSLKLSLRLPPSVDAPTAAKELQTLLTRDPPYGASVTFQVDEPGSGWNAPPLAPWLEQSIDRASQTYFEREACYMGEGGSIPFMGMLGRKYPRAQFMITGVLGPQSNAHGPNEFLHIPMAKRLTACVANVLADHAAR
ncbi:MAG: M20/M25/M40 family metallo-hydrolase [Polyangiaceae bacterium]|nr:M20/M25/M40 family metallo-hydrolase [Polyangiaceae bacterium]